MALLAISASIYLYYFPDTVEKNETSKIQVELASKPDYEKPNGDNVPNITFNAVGYNKVMDISNCALNLINKQKILDLDTGSVLILEVNKKELNSRKTKLVYSPIHIYGIQMLSGEALITLDAYNSCKRISWKKILILGAIVTGIFALFFISEMRNKG